MRDIGAMTGGEMNFIEYPAKKITAVVLNHNYGRFLTECLLSATKYCDEVLVYDDGSTDGSLDLIPRALLGAHRKEASGSCVWGSNKGIEDASGEYIIFLDADNYLLSRPAADADYTYSDIEIVSARGAHLDTWTYPGWPLTAAQALHHFENTATIPMPAGGTWRTEFLREHGCKWREWETSRVAADFRTYIDWLHHNPSLAYRPKPCLAFRVHDTQSSQSPDQQRAKGEAYLLATRGYRL